jgi:hypothetical protein
MIIFKLFSLCVIAALCLPVHWGCGKVTQQIGSKSPGTKAYATFKAPLSLETNQTVVVPGSVPTQSFNVPWSELTTQNANVYVMVYGVRNKGQVDLLSWGHGYRPNWSNLQETVLSHSLTRKDKKIKQPEEGTTFVQYVPGQSPHWEIETSHLTQPYPYLVLACTAGKNKALLLSAVEADGLTVGVTLQAAAPSHYETFIAQLLRLAQAAKDNGTLLPAIESDQLRAFFPSHIWYQLDSQVAPLVAAQTDSPLSGDDIFDAFNGEKKRRSGYQPYLDLYLTHTQALAIYESALDALTLSPIVRKWFLAHSEPAEELK